MPITTHYIISMLQNHPESPTTSPSPVVSSREVTVTALTAPGQPAPGEAVTWVARRISETWRSLNNRRQHGGSGPGRCQPPAPLLRHATSLVTRDRQESPPTGTVTEPALPGRRIAFTSLAFLTSFRTDGSSNRLTPPEALHRRPVRPHRTGAASASAGSSAAPHCLQLARRPPYPGSYDCGRRSIPPGSAAAAARISRSRSRGAETSSAPRGAAAGRHRRHHTSAIEIGAAANGVARPPGR